MIFPPERIEWTNIDGLQPVELVVRVEGTQAIYASSSAQAKDIFLDTIALQNLGATDVVRGSRESGSWVFGGVEPNDREPKIVYLATWEHYKTPTRPRYPKE
jgi:hypothetical protein